MTKPVHRRISTATIVGVDAGTLSSAIVTYVWGRQHRSWPSRDRAAIQIEYGTRAQDIQRALDEVFAVVDSAPTDWAHEDLPTASRRIERLVRAAYPDLSDEAVRAVGQEFSYSWR